jgi:two-component system NtrC family sensor kinase
MKKPYKKKEEKLTSEGSELRQPVAELEAPATYRKQDEQPLGKAEEDKLAILNSISEHVVYQDTEHRILWANKAAAESVGLTPAQLVGRHCYEIWPQRSQPCAGCPVAKACQTGKPNKAEIATPDGRTWSIRSYPILDVNDCVVGVVKVTLDITERKQAENELRKFKAISDKAGYGITIVNLEGNVSYVNASFARIHGYTPDELIGQHLSIFHTEQQMAKVNRLIKQLNREGSYVAEEVGHKRKDSTEFTTLMNGTLVKDEQGTPLFMAATTVDITERKQAEEALKKSEQKYRTIFENVSDVIIRLDNYGKVLDINGKVEEYFGYKPEEVIGKNFATIGALHLKDTPKMVRLFSESIRGKPVPSTIEVEAKRKNGITVLLEVNTTLVKREGKIEGTVAIVRDITDLIQAEEALQESQRFSSSLLANSPNPIDVINPDSSIRYVNPALERLTGFSLAELIGRKPPYPYWTQETIKKTARHLAMGMRRKAVRIEELFRKKNGEQFWVEITSAPVTSNGEFKYLLANWVDITERKQIEEALRQSEKKYKNLAEATSDMIWEVNEKGIFTFVSPRIKDILGYEASEVTGKKKTLDLTTKAEAQKWLKRFKEINAKKAPFSGFEITHLHKNGTPVLFEISGIPAFDNAGNFKGYVGVNRDITERKQAEQALRDSEEKTRKMFESVSDGISVIDLSGVITEVNRRMEEMHGFGSKDELLGKSAFDIVAPRDRDKIARNMRQALKRGTIRDQEYTLLRADGTEFPAELSTSVLKDASGKVTGHITVSRDITGRKQAEQALQAEKNKLQSLINALEDDLSIQDKDYNIIYQNEQSRRSSGGDCTGEKCYQAYEGKDEVDEDCPVKKAFKDGKSHTSERKWVKPSGEVIFWEATANPIRDAGGNIVSCLEVARNITERKQAEEREKELQRELLLSSRLASIGELAAGVAHQINNPLTGVLGFSQRLLRKSTDQETNQDLKRIHTEAERAAKVVQNLLTFARRRQPQKQYSDINEILESALELRAYELTTSNIEVITDLAPKLPEVMLDFYQIQEVFLNIILNAEQAMTEANGGGKLTIKTEERRGYIRTTFTDNGPGIPAEHLEKIFDPFFTTKGEKGGTGLGLSVCHGIISEHGGRIYARSKPGEGATFFVELPLPEH